MIRSNKNKKARSKSKSTVKKRNPSHNDGYDFQSVRFYLSTVFKETDPNEEWSFIGKQDDYTDVEALFRALKFIIPDGSLAKYKKELITPRVKKAMDEFARLLRQQVVATSFRAGINSFTGLEIK